jgi:hypothetical protein
MGLIVEIPSNLAAVTAWLAALLFGLGAAGSAMYIFVLYLEGKTSVFHNRSVSAEYVASIYILVGGFFALIYILSNEKDVSPFTILLIGAGWQGMLLGYLNTRRLKDVPKVKNTARKFEENANENKENLANFARELKRTNDELILCKGELALYNQRYGPL